MMATDKPQLLPFGGVGDIPLALRDNARWAPWRADFNVARGKFDKIPMRADTLGSLSTADPKKWSPFATAVAAHVRAGRRSAGVGYVMTGYHGVVGIDLDCALIDGVIQPWAKAILDRLNTYSEISPSGNGLRAFVRGSIDFDWVNHTRGVEVYQGDRPRFLTVSGRRLAQYPADIAEHPDLSWLSDEYRETLQQSPNKSAAGPVPAQIRAEDLPLVHSLDLPPRALSFLLEGEGGDDRSRTLFSTAVALHSAGLDTTTVFSVLASNPHAFEVALDHRRQDIDKASLYLWEHHAVASRDKGASRILTADDFETFEAEYEEPPEPAPESDFEDLTLTDPEGNVEAPPAPAKVARFTFMQAGAYAHQNRRLEWLIPGVMPKAELGAIYGESGSGKTFFVLDMAVALAGGGVWWGRQIRRKFRVAYVAAEGAYGVQERLQAISKQKGIALADIELYVLGDQPDIRKTEDVKQLLRQLKRLGTVDVVILDTLSQVTPGANENSSEDMGQALGNCKAIHRALGAMVLLIGHSGKDIARGQRGWSGLKGAADVQIEVTRTATYRAASVTKLKDGRGEGVEYMFDLTEVELDYDIEYDEFTSSCVVVPIMSAGDAQERKEKAESQKKAGVNSAGKVPKKIAVLVDITKAMCGPGNKPVKRTAIVALAAPAYLEEGLSKSDEGSRKMAERVLDQAVEAGFVLTDDEMFYTVADPVGSIDGE